MTVTATGLTRTLTLTNAGMTITGSPGDTTEHNESGVVGNHPSGYSAAFRANNNSAEFVFLQSPNNHNITAHVQPSETSIDMWHNTGTVWLNLHGNSWLYTKQIRTEVNTLSLSVPATVTKWFYVYDVNGTAQ